MASPAPASYLASGFRDVDKNPEIRKLVSCLEFMDGLTSFQVYKQEMVDRLRIGAGMAALDVGCGVGFDVARLASLVGPTGRAVGVDPSVSLVRAARENPHTTGPNVSFVNGVGESLDLADETFDVARVDRTLQHVADPTDVLREMRRVLKPGGRIACAEPDWGTFVITSHDRATTRLIAETWCEGFRNGWIGRQLMPILAGLGFAEIEMTGHLLIAEGFAAIDKVYDVAMTVNRVRSAGNDRPGLTEWLNDLREQNYPLACVTLFLVTGVKPQTR